VRLVWSHHGLDVTDLLPRTGDYRALRSSEKVDGRRRPATMIRHGHRGRSFALAIVFVTVLAFIDSDQDRVIAETM